MANCKYYWPSMLSNYVNERLHSVGSGGGELYNVVSELEKARNILYYEI